MPSPATAAVRLLTGEREPVRLATTGPINVDTGGLLVIDSVQTKVGDRILVKNQTDGSENGIRTASEGQWYRAADARTARTMQYGTTVIVQEGSVNAGKTFRFSTLDPVIGDDAITLVDVTPQLLDADLTSWAGVTRAAGFDAFAAAPSSANLRALLTDETGTGAAYFAGGALGTPSSGVATNLTGLPLTTGVTGQLPIANGGHGQATAAAGFDALSPTTTRGDLIFRNATTNARLAASTAGYLLQTNGAGTDPTWVGFTQPTSSSPATRTWNSKAADVVDLRDWSGLDLTDTTDMASIVQAAVNASAAAGVPLNVPAGVIRLNSQITVPAGANIQGPGLPVDRNGAFSAFNAYFHLNHTGIGFLLTGTGQPRRLAGFGTYRNQPAAGGGWTPVNASYDIQVQGVYDATIEDIFLYNATRGIQVTGDTVTPAGNGRITIQNIRGQPILFGLAMTHCYDVCYIDNIHFWPFWSFDTNITNYALANGFAFAFLRVDNPKVGRLFSYGYRYGIWLEQQASVGHDGTLPPGGTSLLKIDVAGLDNCGETGLFISNSITAGPTFEIDSLYAGGGTASSESIVRMRGTNGRGWIGSLFGYRSNKSLVHFDIGTGNDLKIGTMRSINMDNDASGDFEFNVATGNTLTLLSKPITSAANVYNPVGTAVINTPDWDAYRSVLSADRAGADVATVQNVFGSTEDTITLAASTTYEFEAEYMISRAAGTTSHTFATLFGGTATFTSIDYVAQISNPTGNVLANAQMLHATAATATVLTAANTSATEYIVVKLKGEMRINAGGTVIPQFQYSAAPGGAPTIKRNSFFMCKAIGTNTMVSQGPWS